MGLPVFFALVSNGVGVGAAISAVYGVVGGAVIRFGLSALFNAGINALFGKQPTGFQQDLRRQIQQQTELPFKRFVYGRSFAAGTPLPGVALNGFYYVPYLLNSRESEGNFELYLDNRVVQATGDPYDFTGPGAEATNGLFNGHVSYWITRGEKTAPPDVFTSEAGFDAGDPILNALGYKATDAGQGLTVVWLKLKRGTDGTFQDRWPGYPYVNLTVLGDWSKVWDPRDVAQTAADTATHTFSRNQALVALDIAMRNPFRPYPEEFIGEFMKGAGPDVADELVPLKSGGQERRYTCDGTVLFDGSELEQIMRPVMDAGAAQLVRTGGLLDMVPGAAKNIALDIPDMVGLPTVSTITPPESQFDLINVTYSPLDRDGEAASLRPWPIPGVVGAGLPRVLTIDLGMVSSATQAMRIRKIRGLQTTYTRTLDGVAWPETFDALAGSWVTVNLGYTRLDGTYEVVASAPASATSGDDDGIAYRVPMSMRETAPEIYEWVPAVDEEDVDLYEFVYDEEGVRTGGAIAIETGQTINLDTGGTIVPRVRFDFDPSPSSNISFYELQVTETGEPYTATTQIDADARDGDGKVFGFFSGAAGQSYDFRVRAVSAVGFSDWVEFSGATPVVDIVLDVPIFNSVTGGAGQIDIDVSAPNDPDVRSIELVESDSNDPLLGTVFFESAAGQNQTFQTALTGLGVGVTKFIFARVKGDFASVSAYSSGGSATTDP